MKFAPVPITEALGQILGHNVVDENGRRCLRKGSPLSPEDLSLLKSLGRESVWTAVLDEGDVLEDDAALQVTEAAVSGAVRLTGPSTGRVNIHATALGVLHVKVEALVDFNECAGVTLATLPHRSVVGIDRMVATTKILPYAIPGSAVGRAIEVAHRSESILRVTPLPHKRAALIVAASAATQDKVTKGFEKALGQRLEALGSELVSAQGLVHQDLPGNLGTEHQIAIAIREQIDAGADMILLAGETAIQDEDDLAPRAVLLAGGEVLSFGAPVDPGNLLMLGRVGDIPIVGAPGCARSPKRNIVDLVLPRLLLGEELTGRDLTLLGHGGLLEDVAERPLPRKKIEQE